MIYKFRIINIYVKSPIFLVYSHFKKNTKKIHFKFNYFLYCNNGRNIFNQAILSFTR
jgi:hypothetical protein